MAFLMTHFYEGGTAAQYAVVLGAVHPDGALQCAPVERPAELTLYQIA